MTNTPRTIPTPSRVTRDFGSLVVECCGVPYVLPAGGSWRELYLGVAAIMGAMSRTGGLRDSSGTRPIEPNIFDGLA